MKTNAKLIIASIICHSVMAYSVILVAADGSGPLGKVPEGMVPKAQIPPGPRTRALGGTLDCMTELRILAGEQATTLDGKPLVIHDRSLSLDPNSKHDAALDYIASQVRLLGAEPQFQTWQVKVRVPGHKAEELGLWSRSPEEVAEMQREEERYRLAQEEYQKRQKNPPPRVEYGPQENGNAWMEANSPGILQHPPSAHELEALKQATSTSGDIPKADLSTRLKDIMAEGNLPKGGKVDAKGGVARLEEGFDDLEIIDEVPLLPVARVEKSKPRLEIIKDPPKKRGFLGGLLAAVGEWLEQDRVTTPPSERAYRYHSDPVRGTGNAPEPAPKYSGFSSTPERAPTVKYEAPPTRKWFAGPPDVEATVTLRNMKVVIPGTDPTLKGESVIVGAHYDTVNSDSGAWRGARPGFGSKGKLIAAPGADDNGTGTVATMLMLEHFKKHPPKRTMEFHWYDAEEPTLLGGMVGSRYYVESLSHQERRKIKAAFIMDMLGQSPDSRAQNERRGGGFFGGGGGYSGGGYNDGVPGVRGGGYGGGGKHGYNVTVFGFDPQHTKSFLGERVKDPNNQTPLVQSVFDQGAIFLSDNRPYVDRGIPSVLFTDVVRVSDLPDNYHTERDGTKDIDQGHFVHLIQQITRMANAVANE